MTEQHDDQPKHNCRTNPALESCLLVEERRETHVINPRTRVLALFEITVNGEPARIPELMLKNQEFTGLHIVGIVATLNEPEGLFAQCGWFGSDQFDWFWAKIEGVQAVQVCDNAGFRGGERFVSLHTEFANYITLNPHETYDTHWQSTLKSLGVPGNAVWPVGGIRPSWWSSTWADRWPFEQQPKAPKRRASCDTAELQALTQGLSVDSDWSNTTSVPLEAQGTSRQAEGILTHLDHLEPWVLPLDSGLQPVVSTGGRGLGQSARGDGGGKRGGRGAKRARKGRTLAG